MTGSGAGSLPTAVQAGLAGAGIPSLSAGVQRLMTAYRSGTVPDAPVMASRADAAAYAAYRMPATVAATAQALQEMRLSLPDWRPASLLDFGAGTGGAAWAAADQLPSIESMTLLEQSADAIRLGKAIFAAAEAACLRSATWRSWHLAPGGQPSAELRDQPAADVATAAYVLGELTRDAAVGACRLGRARCPGCGVRRAWDAGRASADPRRPGAPDGSRLRRRRAVPASAALPARHRGGLVPLRCPAPALGGAPASEGRRAVLRGREVQLRRGRPAGPAEADTPDGRIVRRPQQRKGLVMLDLCVRDGSVTRELVSKSKGESYRRARKASWGERWPPGGEA